MNNNWNDGQVIRALDNALVEQAVAWHAYMSVCVFAGKAEEMDWTEEFCLLVHHRLDKLKRQGILPQLFDPKEGLREIERAIEAARMGRL